MARNAKEAGENPMTPEQIEIHRKRFEELMRADGFVHMELSRRRDDSYSSSLVDDRFKGYLLCAENMPEIHLPLIAESSDTWSAGYNQCICDLKHRLESQGYTVKTL